jgi:hypothetical protein
VIEQADQRLVEWVRSVVGTAQVSLGLPGAAPADGPQVSVHLFDLQRPAPGVASGSRAPLALTLRYLVSCAASEISEGHRLLGELALAALDQAEFEVELDLPVGLWASLMLPARPAFLLRVPLRRPRVRATAPLVHAFELQLEPVVALHGVVLGPRERPLPGAHVALDGLGLHTRTDLAGRFRFANVPASAGALALVVRAGRREVVVAAGPEARGPDGLVVRLEATA